MKFNVKKSNSKFWLSKQKINDRQFLTDKVKIQGAYISIGIEKKRLLKKVFEEEEKSRKHIFR